LTCSESQGSGNRLLPHQERDVPGESLSGRGDTAHPETRRLGKRSLRLALPKPAKTHQTGRERASLPATRKPPVSGGFVQALFRTRTGDPLLTMEASASGDVMWETRLVKRFPCNSGGFSACSTLFLRDPESPRRAPNLSPERSPNGACVCRPRWQQASLRLALGSAGASVARSGWWRIGELQSRLALRADGVGEARHTRFGECAQELVEWRGG